MIRSFVALDLPDTARHALERLQAGIPVGRLMPPENLHLTLAFLGDQTVETLEALHHELDAIRSPRVALRLSGVELFGGRHRQALAVGVERKDELRGLHDAVCRAARRAGMQLDRRRFRPHVTVARLSGAEAQAERVVRFMEAATSFRQEPVQSSRFALYRSTLTPDGAVHDEMAGYPLG